MRLAAVFASVALALTGLGIYGLLAYTVATRRHEFGVRRALGAETRQVVAQVIREGLGVAMAGGAAGMILAALLAQLLEIQLYGVQARDPLTYAIALLVILGVTAIASWVPTRRATSVEALEALRME